jgi:hypothetical protein
MMKRSAKGAQRKSSKKNLPRSGEDEVRDVYAYPTATEITVIEKGNDGIQLPMWLGSDFTPSNFYDVKTQMMLIQALRSIKGDLTQGKNGTKIRTAEKALVRYYWNALREYKTIENTESDAFDSRAKAIFDIGNMALVSMYLRAKLLAVSGGQTADADTYYYTVRLLLWRVIRLQYYFI